MSSPLPWPAEVRTSYDVPLDGTAVLDEGVGVLTVDVAPERWSEAVAVARGALGCTFFDWLSAVDAEAEGFDLLAHLARHRPGAVDHLVVRTRLPRDRPVVASVAGVYAGAGWHERETHEMFGIDFTDSRGATLDLARLLLPEEFEGHPLRKDFVLASRVARPWPGAKEPGEGADAVPTRRRVRPPGVPVPEEWGPRRGVEGER